MVGGNEVWSGSTHAALGLAEAHGDNIPEVVIDRVLEHAQNVGVHIRLGQHENDVGTGSNIVGPFDVETDLPCPTYLVRIGWIECRQTVRRDYGQVCRWEPVKEVI